MTEGDSVSRKEKKKSGLKKKIKTGESKHRPDYIWSSEKVQCKEKFPWEGDYWRKL